MIFYHNSTFINRNGSFLGNSHRQQLLVLHVYCFNFLSNYTIEINTITSKLRAWTFPIRSTDSNFQKHSCVYFHSKSSTIMSFVHNQIVCASDLNTWDDNPD